MASDLPRKSATLLPGQAIRRGEQMTEGTANETNPAGAEFWDARYRTVEAPWDPEPNPILEAEAAGLPAGKALEVGCGEGSDAVWLARRGWQVVAVDISQVALKRGRQAAPDESIEWRQADLLDWAPHEKAFDLVVFHFPHFSPADRPLAFGRLAQAVKPGGRLLFVTHHPLDLQTALRSPPNADWLHTAEDIAALLEPKDWEILAQDARPRQVKNADGPVHDAVLLARRLPG